MTNFTVSLWMRLTENVDLLCFHIHEPDFGYTKASVERYLALSIIGLRRVRQRRLSTG
jgi:hypothetical protein